MSEKPIIIFKCTLNIPYRYDRKWYFNTGGKKAGVKRRTYKLKRSFTFCMFIRKHTVNTGGKKAEGKKAGVKGRG